LWYYVLVSYESLLSSAPALGAALLKTGVVLNLVGEVFLLRRDLPAWQALPTEGRRRYSGTVAAVPGFYLAVLVWLLAIGVLCGSFLVYLAEPISLRFGDVFTAVLGFVLLLLLGIFLLRTSNELIKVFSRMVGSMAWWVMKPRRGRTEPERDDSLWIERAVLGVVSCSYLLIFATVYRWAIAGAMLALMAALKRCLFREKQRACLARS